MRHNGNDGRNGASDLSRFPVSVFVSYTIYVSRRKLNTVTKPANLPTEPVVSLLKEIGIVLAYFQKFGPFLALLLDITFETNTPLRRLCKHIPIY